MFRRKNDATFRAKKKYDEGSVRQRLHVQAKNTLKRGVDLKQAVKLPPGEDEKEWIAVNGGDRYEYHWQDDKHYKKPTLLPAIEYMTNLQEWVDCLISDPKIFPEEAGAQFPKNFTEIASKILTRLYRVFVHVYHHHLDAIKELQAGAHVNQFYKHFVRFSLEFNLIKHKEYKPLEALNDALLRDG